MASAGTKSPVEVPPDRASPADTATLSRRRRTREPLRAASGGRRTRLRRPGFRLGDDQ
ncbi:hypothetical protein SAMN04487982_111186 [Streptomyces sp. ok210]|nr:hypothetical protein SAMN04487982_111186 [Streptomyces sp. ok210]